MGADHLLSTRSCKLEKQPIFKVFTAQFPHGNTAPGSHPCPGFPTYLLRLTDLCKVSGLCCFLEKTSLLASLNQPHMWALWVSLGASERVIFFKHTGLWFLKEQKAESITSCGITFCWRPTEATSENNQISVLFSVWKWLCKTLEGNTPLKRRGKKKARKMEIEIMRKNKDGELWECFELLIGLIFVKMNVSKNLEVAWSFKITLRSTYPKPLITSSFNCLCPFSGAFQRCEVPTQCAELWIQNYWRLWYFCFPHKLLHLERSQGPV